MLIILDTSVPDRIVVCFLHREKRTPCLRGLMQRSRRPYRLCDVFKGRQLLEEQFIVYHVTTSNGVFRANHFSSSSLVINVCRIYMHCLVFLPILTVMLKLWLFPEYFWSIVIVFSTEPFALLTCNSINHIMRDVLWVTIIYFHHAQ